MHRCLEWLRGALSTLRTASLVPTARGDIVDDSQAGGGDMFAFLFTMIHPLLRACLSLAPSLSPDMLSTFPASQAQLGPMPDVLNLMREMIAQKNGRGSAQKESYQKLDIV